MVVTKLILVVILSVFFLSAVRGSPVIDGDPALRCGLNETVSRCRLCDRDCSQLYIYDPWFNKGGPCPESCFASAPICVCKAGFFRHPNGDCVLENECPPACPWTNEITNYCDQPFDPRCQPTCSNPTIHPNGTIVILDEEVSVPQFYCQYGICHTIVCVCKEGYVRHDDTLRCMKQEECSTLSPAPVAGKDS